MRFSLAQDDPYRTIRCRPWKPRCGEGQLSCSCCASSPTSRTREAIKSAAGRRCSCWASRLTSSSRSPGFDALDVRWRLPVHVVSCGTPAAFWITIGAFFVDEFRARWYHALAWLALAMIAVAEMWVRSTSLFAVHSALSLSCVLLAIWHVLAGRATDLVEGRRRLRVVFAVAIALYTVLIVASDWLWPGGLSVASLSLANAVGLVSLVFLFAVLDSLPSFAQSLTPVAAGPRRRNPSTTACRQRRLRSGPTQRCSPRCAS